MRLRVVAHVVGLLVRGFGFAFLVPMVVDWHYGNSDDALGFLLGAIATVGLGEMARRREKQRAYNIKHRITPQTVVKAIHELEEFEVKAKKVGLAAMLRDSAAKPLSKKNLPHLLSDLERQMRDAADNLNFELAAVLRDQVFELREMSGIKRKGATSAKKAGGRKMARSRR